MSEIVGSASIRIEPDTSGFAQKLQASALAAVRQVENSMKSASTAVGAGAQAQRGFSDQAKKSAAASRGLVGNVNQMRVAFTVLSSVIAGRFLQSIIASRAEFERSQVAFRGLLAESAAVKTGIETLDQAVQGLTEDIRTLSIKSGADFNDLSRGAQSLITGLNLSREVSVGLLNNIAGAAAASGAALDSIPRAVRAITQISAKGFLSAEELNQIADVLPVVARPKIYEELAKALKLPIAEITKLANEGGRITSSQGLPALVTVIQNVAGAATALDRQLVTLPGALNVIRGSAKAAVQDGFDKLSASIVGLVDTLGGATGIKETFKGLLEPLDEITSTAITVLGNAFINLLPSLSKLGAELSQFIGLALQLVPTVLPIIAIFANIATAVLSVVNGFAPLRIALVAIAGAFFVARAATLALSASMLTIGGVLKVIAVAVAAGAALLASFRGEAKDARIAIDDLGASIAELGAKKAFEEFAKVDLSKVEASFDRLERTGVALAIDDTGDAMAAFNKIVDANAFATAKNIIQGIKNETLRGRLNKILEDGKQRFKDNSAEMAANSEILQALGSQTEDAAAAQIAFNEAMKESTSQIEGVISAEGKRIDALEAIADALDAVRDAEQELAGLRSDRVLLVAEQLTELDEARAEALQDIVDLTEDLADAEQAVADARQGVLDAEQGIADARQGVLDANIAVTDSERSLTDAREDLLEATQPATERELAAARRDILSAELALEAATRKRVEAEQALAALERRKLNQGKRLAVLGLDNLRTSLANARASAAAVRTVPDEAELREELRSAIINEAEAAESLVESKEDLLELERQGLDITDEVIEAREAVEKAERAVESAVRARAAAERDVDAAIRGHAAAERDVASALGDQADALVALTAAQNIDLALAPFVKTQKEDLVRLDGQIADAVDRQKKASEDVKKAREDELIATQALDVELAVLAGLADAEFNGLVDRIALYERLGLIGSEAYKAIQAELAPLLAPKIADLLVVATTPDGRIVIQPRFSGPAYPGYEQGGIITKPTVAMMGEHGLKEVVLPLTKPARAFQLAQQSGFLDMLSKHQQPFFPAQLSPKSSPTMIRTQRSGPSGSVGVHDPEVVAQLRALNEKLNKANLGETIDIDITGVGTVDDKLKMRQLSRQVEKAVRRGRR